MNRLDLRPPDMVSAPASSLDLRPARCLIVLVPEIEMDLAAEARRIRELANALECQVQLIGLSKDAESESDARRLLVTLGALVGDDKLSVESKVEPGGNWLNAVKPYYHRGDVIACFAGQRSGLAQRPVNQILESNLHAAVFVFDSLGRREEWPRMTWKSNAMAWGGSIGIILGFLWLQAMITQSQDWAHTTLLYFSIFVEAGAIWVWNNLF